MAIYHCHCKIISRGQGRSAVGAAAYRSGEKITNEYDGITHDYTNKSGVVYAEIMLPENAPQEWQDRATLWNEVERIEKGSRAQLAREYEVALPRELSGEEQIQLVRDFVKENFVKKGMCADIAIHDKEDGNPHAHILLTTRPIEHDGIWGKKAENTYVLDKNGNRILQKIDKQNRKIYKRIKKPTTDWDSKEFLQRSRENWAAAVNRELERKNLPQRVDHRSLADQKKEQIPTEHIGVAAKSMEKRGEVSDRGERHREILRANSQLEQISGMEKAIQTHIKVQEFLSEADRIGGEVIHDVVGDTEKKLEQQPKATDQQREILRKQIQENFENLPFIAKNGIYSYEQIETNVADLWQKHNACVLELDKARRFASMGVVSAEREQRIENLSRQLATLRAAIADYQKCGEVLRRIDQDNGGTRAQTFQRVDALMKGQGRTMKQAPERRDSPAVERLKGKIGQSQQTRQRETAPLIGGRATEAAQGAYGRLQEKSEAVKEKMQRESQPKPAPAAPRTDFSFTALLDAQKEAFTESAALYDMRRPASPAVLARPQELREAVAGLETAKNRLDAITMPPKPPLFASRKVKDEYEQEYREKRTQQDAAGAECRKQFDKLVSFGVSRYAYDPATQYSAEIDPAHISAGELKQLKDHAAVKLKELEQGAAQERQGAKPAD
ncbi:MAG: MobA/MobL family protein, partial [Ruminococcus flavefaciens]|nr:MobA/MobL family protein [Ruminococcus flavefaciens]